ncbi:MAG: carbohydrate kinase [Paracoccaceae bacterium]
MILCCGEALIDMLPRQTETGESAFAPHAGGSVFNTAIALGRLGAPAGFFSGLSRDLFGQILTAALDGSGVDWHLAALSDRPTTLAFVTLDGGQARYAFYDEGTAGRMLGAADLPAIPDTVSALFLGGISLVCEPAATSYEALALREANRRVVMIDPNIRPGFISDEPAYRARLGRMIAAADIVKISDEDLHWLEGPGAPPDLARRLLGRGPSIVFLTEGAEGARAVTRDLDVFEPAHRVAVVDTVGAGDTFNAGVLTALHEAGALTHEALGAGLDEADLRAALSLGVRAAAITVSRAGANPPLRAEL